MGRDSPPGRAAWVGQGPLSDRTKEHLATSDKGVILYHNLLLENVAKVEQGEDPMFTIRDEAENTPYIHVARERESSKLQVKDLVTGEQTRSGGAGY